MRAQALALAGRGVLLCACIGVGGCSVFTEQPPCQADENCLPDQVCDPDTHTCVPRPDADAGATGADAGERDARPRDRQLADGGAADRAVPDIQAQDRADAAAADGALADAAVADSSGEVDGGDAGELDASGLEAGPPDAALADAVADSSAVEDALLEDGAEDAAEQDGAGADAGAQEAGRPDVLEIDAGWRERLCDGQDDDGDGDVDEGCDDDGDGYCDRTMFVIGSPSVCPNSPDGVGDDCDDTMPTCTTDCTTNSDGDFPPVSDCVEAFCGSDPLDPVSRCRIVASRSAVDNAIDAINDEDGVPDFLLLEGMQHEPGFSTITSDDGLTVRQRPGASLRIDSHPHEQLVFEVEGDNVTFDGLRLVNVQNANTWIAFSGASGTVRHCVIEGYGQAAIVVAGAIETVIQDNVIVGGDGDSDAGDAAISIYYSTDTTIVGNLLVDDESGIHLAGANGVTIDHNTIALAINDALRFHSVPSSGVCMRNNIVYACSSALDVEVNVGWEVGAGCTGPLDASGGGPDYGNSAFDNVLLCEDTCEGSAVADCSACLPSGAGDFWEIVLDPRFATTTYGHVGYYCPGAAELIDSADPLGDDPVYDRNGAQPGLYNGAGPEIGARELGTPACAPAAGL